MSTAMVTNDNRNLQNPMFEVIPQVLDENRRLFLNLKAAAHEACINNFFQLAASSFPRPSRRIEHSYLLNQASLLERQPAVTSFRSRKASKLQTESSLPKNK